MAMSALTTKKQDEFFMQQVLDLAKQGYGHVSPNPLVGCVIVKNDQVIATGFHQRFGHDHAEIDALKKINFKAKDATLYVNLEPCHHYGKTPPCVDAVISAGVSRVVIAMLDVNPLTSGKSVKKMKKAGITVQVGVCAAEAEFLNRFFIKFIQTKIPYVIAKVAQSLDGKISTKIGKQDWFTGQSAQIYVQQLRAQIDAVLIGRQTLLIDNPRLNVRNGSMAQPKRVVLDSLLKTPLQQQKIFTAKGGEVIFVCTLAENHQRVIEFKKNGITVVCVPSRQPRVSLRPMLKKLGVLGMTSILVEGGAEIFTEFYRAKQVDEWQILIAPQVVGEQGYPAFLQKVLFKAPQQVSLLGQDTLMLILTH